MAKFVAGQSQTTDVPTISVDVTMAAGRHRFRLVVVDSSGNQSAPSEVVVTVRGTAPVVPPLVTPVVRPLR
jgi:hypothetical protein